MKREQIINILNKKFPESEFNLLNQYSGKHSIIYFMSKKEKDSKKNIVVKHITRNPTSDGSLFWEYKCQKKFNENFKDHPKINSPKIFDFDNDKKILIMGYVQGVPLKNLLISIKSLDKDYLNYLIDLSGKTLAYYHQIFSLNDKYKLKNNNFIKDYKKIFQKDIERGNLNIFIKPYIDYTPSNILVNNNEISLIDFPNRNKIGTPHLDLARFRFYLKLLLQKPRFRILRLNWWEVDSIFERFINSYSRTIGRKLNSLDFESINKLEEIKALEFKDYINSCTNNPKGYARKIYLTSFFDEIINTR